jgi:uncharacterized protein (TIGR03382 family)
LCCTRDAPFCCNNGFDGGLVCSNDQTCGEDFQNQGGDHGGRRNDYGGCSTASGGLFGGALALVGISILRRRRARR